MVKLSSIWIYEDCSVCVPLGPVEIYNFCDFFLLGSQKLSKISEFFEQNFFSGDTQCRTPKLRNGNGL